MTPGSPDDAWAPAPAAAPPPQATVLLPGYEDFQPIARGGSSDVFSAVQITTRRPVAVKVVHLRDAEAIRHFERELEITVRLGRQHPNIVTVLDTGVTSEGLPCLVMELADLGSVDARLRELGPLPVGDVVALGTVIADALAFAHQQGVLHRDIKPPNILVLPTSYVLTDFGIARTLDAGHSASMEQFSYRHAAPQVLDGEMPAAADDVYSLGSTMFTLLEGHAPFAGPTPEEDSALGYLRRARTTEAPALARPDIPAQLGVVIARCLARERGDRPAASELHELLLAVPTEARGWAGRPVPSAPPEPVEPEQVQPPAVEPPPVEPPPVQPVPDVEPPAPSLTPEREALLLATAASFGAEEFAPEQTVAMRAEAPRPPAPAARNRRGILPWAAALILLLAGATALFLTHRGTSTPTIVGQPITRPSLTATSAPAPAPSPSVTASPPVAPRLISAKRVGKGVRLHWTDPSGGLNTMLVVQIVNGVPQAFPAIRKGTTQLTVTPRAATPPLFFAVITFNEGAQNASNQVTVS